MLSMYAQTYELMRHAVRPNIRCSESGGGVVVTIVASRAPGR